MYVKRIQSFLGKKGLASIYSDNTIKFLYEDKMWYITYKNDNGYKFYNIVTSDAGDSCLSYEDLKSFIENLIK